MNKFMITSENPKVSDFDTTKVENVTMLYRESSSGLNHIEEISSFGHDARKDLPQNEIPAAFTILNNVQLVSNMRKVSQTFL
ncbi:hypothetical protein [Ligilactobacillus salitolerans]|nr:hypothetical protein [Ligilactobacillus salitolerans]